MIYDINLVELQKDAVDIFHNGFACSESVVYSIRKHFNLDISDDAIAMSSGFPWGLGGGGCICGALAGGTMCLGLLYGHRTPNDPKINRCFKLTKEIHDDYKDCFNATCCRVLMNGLEREDPKRKENCSEIVKFTVTRVAEIIQNSGCHEIENCSS